MKTHKERLRERIQKNKKLVSIDLVASLFTGTISYFFLRNILTSLIIAFSLFALVLITISLRNNLKKSAEVGKMENAFPDFLQLMSSNLRAGITIDRSLLLSSRKEFAPLDKEILKLGKDILTGKKMEDSLLSMAKRIHSEKISKSISLIISGIKSGGNIAILLDETSRNMKERSFVEKKAASNVLMYVIFIFFATSMGAPILFALSSVLVKILSSVLSGLPDIETDVSLPFTLKSLSVSTEFITYFSLFFLIVTNILGALILGLVMKGEEKAGVKFILPLVGISVLVFFIIRLVLLSYFSNLF